MARTDPTTSETAQAPAAGFPLQTTVLGQRYVLSPDWSSEDLRAAVDTCRRVRITRLLVRLVPALAITFATRALVESHTGAAHFGVLVVLAALAGLAAVTWAVHVPPHTSAAMVPLGDDLAERLTAGNHREVWEAAAATEAARTIVRDLRRGAYGDAASAPYRVGLQRRAQTEQRAEHLTRQAIAHA